MRWSDWNQTRRHEDDHLPLGPDGTIDAMETMDGAESRSPTVQSDVEFDETRGENIYTNAKVKPSEAPSMQRHGLTREEAIRRAPWHNGEGKQARLGNGGGDPSSEEDRGDEPTVVAENRSEENFLQGTHPNGDEAATTVLRLCGLPVDTTVDDILAFFSDHRVEDGIDDVPCPTELLFEDDGRFAGQAEVQMRSRHYAEVAQEALNHKDISDSPIEVFLYGADD